MLEVGSYVLAPDDPTPWQIGLLRTREAILVRISPNGVAVRAEQVSSLRLVKSAPSLVLRSNSGGKSGGVGRHTVIIEIDMAAADCLSPRMRDHCNYSKLKVTALGVLFLVRQYGEPRVIQMIADHDEREAIDYAALLPTIKFGDGVRSGILRSRS